jgi:DNA-binding NtrC family response regulator
MENAIMRAAVMARGRTLNVEDFALSVDLGARNGDEEGGVTLENVERKHVLHILERTGGNKSHAARLLAISRPRLDRILARVDSGGKDEE